MMMIIEDHDLDDEDNDIDEDVYDDHDYY